MGKCSCGYECRLPGEQEMLERYGCARTIERRQQPFNNLIVTMCDRATGSPEVDETSDDTSFTEAFKRKYQKPEKPKKDEPTS